MKTAKIVIGANFGDEGKGLMTDYFADKARDLHKSCLVVCHIDHKKSAVGFQSEESLFLFSDSLKLVFFFTGKPRCVRTDKTDICAAAYS